MTDLIREMLPVIANEGDMGFLIAADEFDNSSDPENVRFGQLLRRYVEIQTYIRMSQPIPVEMADSFKKLNDSFDNAGRFRIEGTYAAYYDSPFGPFYTKLTSEQSVLANNLFWLERQPVRELVLSQMSPGGDLSMILRNHRFQALKRVTIQPSYRTRDVAGIAAAVRQMTAHSLQSLTFEWGINDRLGLVKSAFASNKTIPPGAELFMHRTRVWVKK